MAVSAITALSADSAIFGGSAVPPLLLDTFTDTNGTALAAHTMEIGAGWTVLEGSWTIQSNAAHGGTNNVENRAVADSGKTNVTVTATGFSPTGGTRLGLLARYLDATHGYECYWDGNSGVIQIWENNFTTIRGQVSLSYVLGKTWNLQAVVSGTSLSFTVTQADTPSHTATVTFASMAVDLTNTKFGILQFTNEANANLDNFQVVTP